MQERPSVKNFAIAAHNASNRLGQAARPARRAGDRQQEVVELNSKVRVRDERNKKQESFEVRV
jgi:hypothetical protein